MQSNHCYSTYSNSTGPNKFAFCVTSTGTINRLESPANKLHLGAGGSSQDGFVLCAEDAGGDLREYPIVRDALWKSPVISQPNGLNTFPLAITMTTHDLDWRVRQEFTWDTVERDIRVRMLLTNQSGRKPVQPVQLSRWAQFDAEGTATDAMGDKTADSAWQRDATNGVMLSAFNVGVSHTAQIESESDFSACCSHDGSPVGSMVYCGEGYGVATPTGAGDWVSRVTYNVGSMAAGSMKDVSFLYRRI